MAQCASGESPSLHTAGDTGVQAPFGVPVHATACRLHDIRDQRPLCAETMMRIESSPPLFELDSATGMLAVVPAGPAQGPGPPPPH